jgi:uncharacterized protein YdeI (YjbR/CyaY-like superfamily)
VTPDPAAIRPFVSAAAFERWLRANHSKAAELWLRIYKKDSGVASVTAAEALEVCLCWGWIDGLRKGFDAESFLQRYTPRRPKSMWSQVNRDHIARLTKAGRMQAPGLKQVELARADGRWDAAYAPIRSTSVETMPADLMKAINKSPKARKAFKTLSKMNLFAMQFRTNNMKTPAGRAKKIAELVAMLERGQTIVPQ